MTFLKSLFAIIATWPSRMLGAILFMYGGWSERSLLGKGGLIFTWLLTVLTMICLVGQYFGLIKLG